MEYKKIAMGGRKRVALVAYANTKFDLMEWSGHNRDLLSEHDVIATGMIGGMLERELGIVVVTKPQSGVLGGDQQIGARITEGIIDFPIFLCDSLQPTLTAWT